MNEGAGTGRSQLFTLRIWVEQVNAGRIEIRGLVHHVISGESTYFRDWSTLVAFLEQWALANVEDTNQRSPF